MAQRLVVENVNGHLPYMTAAGGRLVLPLSLLTLSAVMEGISLASACTNYDTGGLSQWASFAAIAGSTDPNGTYDIDRNPSELDLQGLVLVDRTWTLWHYVSPDVVYDVYLGASACTLWTQRSHEILFGWRDGYWRLQASVSLPSRTHHLFYGEIHQDDADPENLVFTNLLTTPGVQTIGGHTYCVSGTGGTGTVTL